MDVSFLHLVEKKDLKSCGQIHSLWLGEPMYSLAGRYDNPMPELTLSPQVRDYEFGYWLVFYDCIKQLDLLEIIKPYAG
jgi:hypothetical protein